MALSFLKNIFSSATEKKPVFTPEATHNSPYIGRPTDWAYPYNKAAQDGADNYRKLMADILATKDDVKTDDDKAIALYEIRSMINEQVTPHTKYTVFKKSDPKIFYALKNDALNFLLDNYAEPFIDRAIKNYQSSTTQIHMHFRNKKEFYENIALYNEALDDQTVEKAYSVLHKSHSASDMACCYMIQRPESIQPYMFESFKQLTEKNKQPDLLLDIDQVRPDLMDKESFYQMIQNGLDLIAHDEEFPQGTFHLSLNHVRMKEVAQSIDRHIEFIDKDCPLKVPQYLVEQSASLKTDEYGEKFYEPYLLSTHSYSTTQLFTDVVRIHELFVETGLEGTAAQTLQRERKSLEGSMKLVCRKG